MAIVSHMWNGPGLHFLGVPGYTVYASVLGPLWPNAPLVSPPRPYRSVLTIPSPTTVLWKILLLDGQVWVMLNNHYSSKTAFLTTQISICSPSLVASFNSQITKLSSFLLSFLPFSHQILSLKLMISENFFVVICVTVFTEYFIWIPLGRNFCQKIL